MARNDQVFGTETPEGSGLPGPGPRTGPAPPPPTDPFLPASRSVNRFRRQSRPFNRRLNQLSQTLIDRGTGTEEDPLIAAQREQAISALRGNLSRSGVTGSAALNQEARLGNQFDLASIGRQDALLEQGVGLGQLRQGNLLANPALQIGLAGAQQSGQGGGGGKK